MADQLELFTIYANPRDHPGMFVVRRWRAIAGSDEPVPDVEPLAITTTIEAARQAIPASADTRLPRQPADDPAIAETWL